MSLPPNTTLAHYKIISKIGAGGMGEVYRARDSRLDREVAIKLLPAKVSTDQDRLERFELEARATSALNHPNILTVYDIGTNNGSPFIVSELLEGEELRDRLEAGAIPLRKTIDYAQQIVSGLSAAHEKGIVHRDLKPENLFITNDDRVKILDFGLAKLRASNDGSGSEDETRKVITNPGVVMGTVGYMSPEQVRGEKADYRSDIFSFGAILYEMITGRRAFRRDTVAETMTAILKEEPEELSASNPNINPALERIVNRCLEKKPERRFHSAYDLGFALESLQSPSSSSGKTLTDHTPLLVIEKRDSKVWRERLPWIAVGVLAIVAAVALAIPYFNRPATSGRATWLSFAPPPSLHFNDNKYDYAVISPDGQKIAFTAYSPEGKTSIYLQDLNSGEPQLLPATDIALEPFWSPDSKSIAFGAEGKLKRIEISGGKPKVLCDAARLTGGTWGAAGVIVFGPDYGQPLFQVSADGGEPQQVTFLDPGEGMHRHPKFLPDGKHIIFARTGKGLWSGSIQSREVKQIVSDSALGVYANGRLLYVRNQVLVAQAFDVQTLQLSGEAESTSIPTDANVTGQVRFSVSDNGTLLFHSGWEREHQLVWFDRNGKQIDAIGKPDSAPAGQEPHLSPDGKRLTFKRDGIWVSDLNGENAIKLGGNQFPTWSPDGTRVFISGNFGPKGGIWERAATGVGDPVLVLEGAVFSKSVSPDRKFLVYMHRGVKTRSDVWVLPLGEGSKGFSILETPADELGAELSPDGKWLAYLSDETGTYEVYVQSFNAEGKLGTDRKRISSGGGLCPVWSGNGKELFYVAPDGMMMAVGISPTAGEFQVTAPPKALFKTRMLAMAALSVFHEFDVTADGQRFLIGTLIGESKSSPPKIILNWTAALKK